MGELTESDFASVAKIIDPFIETQGGLKGIVIHVRAFPGWDSFGALVAHMGFVRDHHREVARVAFVTDSPVGTLAEQVASHFVSAEVRSFAFDELPVARDWIAGSHD